MSTEAAEKKVKKVKKVKKEESNGTMEIELVREKETKGAWRYMEDKEPSEYPKNIYFRKSELEEMFGECPESLKVTVEVSE